MVKNKRGEKKCNARQSRSETSDEEISGNEAYVSYDEDNSSSGPSNNDDSADKT